MFNIPFSWRTMLVVMLLVILVAVCQLAGYYHSQYITADKLAGQRQETINDMQRRQKSIAALDEKYTKELADAKATIDQLHDDVSAGKRRLQLNATCKRVPGTTATPGMDDAARAELTPDAERAYWRLREQLATADKQIAGLQEYIRAIETKNISKIQ